MSVEITDPAKELALLADYFAGQPEKGQTTAAHFARAIGVAIDSPDYHEILAAIQRRVSALQELLKEVDDPNLDEQHRGLINEAAKQFREFLHPQRAHEPWSKNVKVFLLPQNITALRFFGQTARRYRPLRVVPEDVRQHAIERVHEAIASVNDDETLEAWARAAAISGLERLIVALKYLKFFGHEAAIAELLLAHAKIAAMPSSLWSSKGIVAALAAINLYATIFILPDQALTAIDRYKNWDWPNRLLESVVKTPPEQQRLLPPPAALRPKDEHSNLASN